ncbi:MAG: GDSL-type esterase/lipase family protein, partial [Verrucomicrobiota bacterium]
MKLKSTDFLSTQKAFTSRALPHAASDDKARAGTEGVTFSALLCRDAGAVLAIQNFMIQKTIQVLVMAVCVAFMGTARALDDAKPFDTFGHREVIRMVCIGDSITQADAYVSALRMALGSAWEVTNFGVSGATMLKTGDKPYNRLAQYGQAMQKKPDVATIMLGTND